MTRRPVRPPCEACGTPTIDKDDRSGSWNWCPQCKHVQDVVRIPGGEGYLTQ